MKPLFQGSERIAYRDPACIRTKDGIWRLFFTVSEKRDGFLLNRLGMSSSRDLQVWTEPRCLTPLDANLNYCSPGSILEYQGEYLICLCSYPMPYPYETKDCANENARLFLMRTRDFTEFSEPMPLAVKGDIPNAALGRMIDPFLFCDRDDPSLFHLFFKQRGVGHSVTRDFVHFTFLGHIDGGENACVLIHDGQYLLLHSPKDGIGIKVSDDLSSWRDLGLLPIDRASLPFADGRLTAGFALCAPEDFPHRYLLFFHGSRADSSPETHGAASLGLLYTDDFKSFYESCSFGRSPNR